MIKTTLTLLAATALLAACAGTPTQAPPTAAAPMAPFAQSKGLPSGQSPQADWWSVLGDPTLDEVVRRGLQANLDIRQAAERVLQSRALAAGAHAERGPRGGVGVAAVARQLSSTEAPGLERGARRSDQVSAGLDLQWELDLFGRLGAAAHAAEARAEAADAEADAVRLLVTAEIADIWYALEGARDQLRVARDVLENRASVVALVQRRAAAGYSAPIDDVRARADLAAAQAELPVREAAVVRASHRLAVLLGESPSTFQAPPSPQGLPRLATLRVPDPTLWMSVRPDLRAEEATLRAAGLDVDAVRAEFMPRVSVSGLLAFVAGTASGLGAAGSASWFMAPGISLPIFDRARIQARLAAAQSRQRSALLAYRQRVLLATEEVEVALLQTRQGQLRLAALHDRVREANAAEMLARKRYEAGASDLLELLDAQRGAHQARQDLSAALSDQQRQVVGLQRALGARFEAAPIGA